MTEQRTAAVLRLTIEFPGFYVEGDESDEDIEIAMQLQSDNVIAVFDGFEGDSPGTVLRSLEGQIKKFEVRRV